MIGFLVFRTTQSSCHHCLSRALSQTLNKPQIKSLNTQRSFLFDLSLRNGNGLRRNASHVKLRRDLPVRLNYRQRTTKPPPIPKKAKGETKELKIENETEQFVPSIRELKKGDIKRFYMQAYSERWRIAAGVGLLLVASSVTMAVPYFVGKVIDMVAASGPDTLVVLNRISLGLLGVFFVGAAAVYGRIYLFQSCAARLIAEIRNKLYGSLVKQDMTFYDQEKTGQLVNRLANDCWTVGEALTQNISDGLRSLMSSAIGVGMMFFVSAKLAVVGLLTVPPIAILGMTYGRFVKRITEKINDAYADSTQVASERLGNMRTVHAFSKEKLEAKVFGDSVAAVMAAQYKEVKAKAAFYSMVRYPTSAKKAFTKAGLSGNMVVLSVLYYGGLLMARGEISVGDLSAFLLYAGYVGVSFAGLSSFYSEMMRGVGASTKLWEIMDRPPKIPIEGGLIPPRPLKPVLKLDHVNFSYGSRREVPVLKDLSLVIPEGSFTAFVGPSGSGKSTIISLILRLYDPDSGSIYFDDIDIKKLSPEWLHANIGLVPQDIHLFSTTIFENIVYGASHPVTTSDVEEACQRANAYDFIMKLPQKFDTLVGERGLLLSGGQRQRISIARALVKNPKILLLDEATSSLDSESESQVQAALKELMRDRTVVTVAHRLATIRNADQILVLDQGKIIEAGDYSNLMARSDGAFRRLIEQQMLSLS